jgi:hypothetical protein
MDPRGLAGAPPSERERVFAFCGACAHFEEHALGGGGDCRRGHDPDARAFLKHCPDRTLLARGSGPAFDMSE